jgi:hypothetical protein
MSSVAIPRTLAIAAVVAAVAAVAAVITIGGRIPSNPPLLSSDPTESQPSAIVAPTTEAPAAERETPIAAKVRELETMSETFRNTTFLIAIRDSGYRCNELLRVIGGLDDAPKWLASCSEMLSYTVAVASNGTLQIEPMLQYFDGQTPQPLQQDGERRLPQELLPHQR